MGGGKGMVNPYISDPLHVALSVSNHSGVAYRNGGSQRFIDIIILFYPSN